MKLRNSFSIIKAMVLLSVLSSCSQVKKQNHIKPLIDSLTKGQFVTDTTIDEDFRKAGKDAIPFLINAIDRNKMGDVGFQNPESSYIRPFYVGIRAAYMIEYILSNGGNHKIYEYGAGVIRSFNGKIFIDTLTYDNMKAIKAIYIKWWEKNKDKSLEKLRYDWGSHRRALDNTIYKWY